MFGSGCAVCTATKLPLGVRHRQVTCHITIAFSEFFWKVYDSDVVRVPVWIKLVLLKLKEASKFARIPNNDAIVPNKGLSGFERHGIYYIKRLGVMCIHMAARFRSREIFRKGIGNTKMKGGMVWKLLTNLSLCSIYRVHFVSSKNLKYATKSWIISVDKERGCTW